MLEMVGRELILVTGNPELLARLGSAVEVITVARLVAEPELVVPTVIVTWTLPPLEIVPSEQLTEEPDGLQLPWLAMTERKLTPGGRVSLRVTFSAPEGPRFVTSSV